MQHIQQEQKDTPLAFRIKVQVYHDRLYSALSIPTHRYRLGISQNFRIEYRK